MKFNLSPNPVLVKELRGRMRGARAYLILTGTLAVLGLVSYGLYRIARFSAQSYGGQQSAMIGQGVFVGLVFFALGVICFITPALTAGAISGEYERKTFDMLMATPLRPASVVFGKLLASLSYAALLIVAAVPLVSLSYVFGGVATIDMVQALLLLFGYTLTFGVLGMFFSTMLHRSGLATVLSYIVLAVFVFGTMFVYGVIGVVRQQQPPSWILALNPFSAMASALVSPAMPNVLSMSGYIQPLLWVLGGGGVDLSTPMSMPLWRYTVGIYAWLTVALYIASAVLVRPVHRFRLGARGWAGLALFVIVSLAAIPVLYGPLTPARIFAWVRWNRSAKQNLVANGAFASTLEPVWMVVAEAERTGESGGEVKLTADGGRQVASFSRAGGQHAETGITQIVSQSVPVDGWLQLRVVLRVQSQDVDMCGVLGSECPLMVKLVYEDVAGGRHEWMQGFYAVGSLASSSTPPVCTTCEINQPHIQVPQGKWYTYESPDLLTDLAARGYALPQVIRSIALSAAGHSYEAQVAEVALLAREGRPPDWGGWFRATPTPPPFPMMGVVYPAPMIR
jgi:ABC-2 type transport system permease protein